MLCSGSTQRKDPLRVYSVKDIVCWHLFLFLLVCFFVCLFISAFTNQRASSHYTQDDRTYYILLDLITLIISTVNKAEKTYCFWWHQRILNVLIPKDLAVFSVSLSVFLLMWQAHTNCTFLNLFALFFHRSRKQNKKRYRSKYFVIKWTSYHNIYVKSFNSTYHYSFWVGEGQGATFGFVTDVILMHEIVL